MKKLSFRVIGEQTLIIMRKIKLISATPQKTQYLGFEWPLLLH